MMIDIGAGDKANALARIHKGLLSVPVLSAPEVEAHEFAPVVRAFCDSEELERAAKKFGQAQDESWLQPEFSVLEEVFLRPDWDRKPDNLLIRAGQRATGWEHVGRLPRLEEDPRVSAVIGTFNKAMTWHKMIQFFRGHGEPWLYAGAWIRDAYLLKRPDYDGKGEIFFPDEYNSLWMDQHETRGGNNRHYPCLWHDAGKIGIGGMTWVGNKISAGRRIVCLERTKFA